MLRHFQNGRVYASAHAEAAQDLWVYDGKVVDGIEAAELIGAGTDCETVDLRGASIVPGFRDGHCHPLFAAREALGLHITECVTVEDVLSALGAYRAANSGLDWIDGAIYERSMTAGRELEAAQLLDSVVADVPVVLHADDHHTLWVNSAALAVAGLGSAGAVADAQGKIQHGSIDIDANGKATGILREWEAMSLVLDRAPKLSMAEELHALDLAQQMMLANGLVAAQEAWVDPGMAEIYLEAARLDRLKIRIDLAFRFAPGEWRDRIDYFKQVREQVNALAHPLLTANTAKFFADGAFGSATAHVHLPYQQPSAGGGAHGQAVWHRAELFEATTAAAEQGFALHIHAIGDAGVSDAIDAIEAAGAPARSVIAHTELVREGDFVRFARLGITANFEPYWAQRNAMLLSCVPRLGNERVDRMYEMRTAIETGVQLSFGSDWPVSSFVPLEGIQVAVTRATLAAPGDRWTPEQAVTAREAVAAYTEGVARQMGDLDALALLSDNRADFVILENDPFSGSPETLIKSNVLATWVGGQNVFSA